MKIAIIDADIVGKPKHRFPNLCCMKLSAYHKKKGDSVVLKTDYDGLEEYDKVFISKVFTDTEVPGEPQDKTNKNCDTIAEWYEENSFLHKSNIEFGGTGFFYDKAPCLPEEIEHIKPDYHLYDEWVEKKITEGYKRDEFAYYLDYSIGYLTRKCFRHCDFCVNRNYNGVVLHSPLFEFYDKSRPKICLLDDNFFGCPQWKMLSETLKAVGKPFQFKQGLDERLLTEEKVEELKSWKYCGDYIFAFDNIADRDVIVSKLELLKRIMPKPKHRIKFYVFCGYDRNNIWDEKFWHDDIRDLFERIYILRSFGVLPYVMRHEEVYKTEYSSFYSQIAAWCNQPSLFLKLSFDTFCKLRGMNQKNYAKYKKDIEAYILNGGKKGASWRAMNAIEEKFPDLAESYFSRT